MRVNRRACNFCAIRAISNKQMPLGLGCSSGNNTSTKQQVTADSDLITLVSLYAQGLPARASRTVSLYAQGLTPKWQNCKDVH